MLKRPIGGTLGQRAGMSEEEDALRAMSPRSRTLALAQFGLVGARDWEELQTMGEAAQIEERSGGDLAARIERWKAVERFVTGYRGLALASGALGGQVLDFYCVEHEMWCWQVTDQIAQGMGDGILTRSQQRRFEAKYDRMLGGHRAAEEWLRWMLRHLSGRREMLGN